MERPLDPDLLTDLLGPMRAVEVVDVGANPLDEQAPYALLLESGGCRVTGFEPQREALEELLRRAGPNERYLPYAVGDGADHELRLCASSGFSSLLEPDPMQLALLTDFPAMAEVVQRVPITTRRLDDIAEIDRVDYLKIDVQGGELAVFRSGRSALSQVVAVQTEVAFHRLYVGAPTWGEVDVELRGMGLVPHGFVSTKTWPVAPVQWADADEGSSRQLIEADVLYVRDPARLGDIDDDGLRASALVAHAVYGASGVVVRALGELAARGAVRADAVSVYRRRLSR